MTIPAGFAPHTRSSPVTAPWEPIYAAVTDAAFILGLVIAEQHCNSRGLLHGGVIAALADNAMGLSVARRYDPPVAPITVNLSIDYLGLAKIGQWLDVTTQFIKTGKTLAFAGCLVHADGKPIARGNATFSV
ncbi:MAG: thioesterase [Alphaproteobacteria bacterium PA4]|nr:MAG: thioesterase [Alphaproteobacteria bacterium PA4]